MIMAMVFVSRLKELGTALDRELSQRSVLNKLPSSHSSIYSESQGQLEAGTEPQHRFTSSPPTG
jgi:hypothetical protein